MKKRVFKHLLAAFLACTMVGSSMSVTAFGEGGVQWDEGKDPTHTAFITQKEGYWTNQNEYLAELLLAVNGTQRETALDVVICLDRSGSMDMTYKQGGTHMSSCPCLNQEHFYLVPTGEVQTDEAVYEKFKDQFTGFNLETLQTEHEKPAIEIETEDVMPEETELTGKEETIPDEDSREDAPEVAENESDTTLSALEIEIEEIETVKTDESIEPTVLTESVISTFGWEDLNTEELTEFYEAVFPWNDGEIIVYNAETKEWVVLDTTGKVHLYFEFCEEDEIIKTVGNKDYYSYDLAPFHFKMVEDAFVRISKWNTDDVRKGSNEGLWDHADKAEVCFDRWMEAGDAVNAFADYLVGESAGSENRVALVPFSVRDSAMIEFLNNIKPDETNWLIDNVMNGMANYFTGRDINGTDIVINGDQLEGTYSSVVNFTDDAANISNTIGQLFTTGSTDYSYALSMAYNLIAERTDKDRNAIVIFLSDGKPYPNGAGFLPYAFANQDSGILNLAKAIKNTETTVLVEGVEDPLGGDNAYNFWNRCQGKNYQRHDVDMANLNTEDGNVVSVPGLGARLITIGYMMSEQTQAGGLARLKQMSSDDSFLKVDEQQGSVKGELQDILKSLSVFPGGRNAVLVDEISKYFYVANPADPVSDSNVEDVQVEIVTDENGVEFIRWILGDVYRTTDDLFIKVPIVLKDEWRQVAVDTFYPTNADIDEYPLTGTDVGPDRKTTGAKLDYMDFDGNKHFDTIVTPKLPVYPSETENTDPVSTSVDLSVKKILQGDRPDQNVDFVFTLTGLNDPPMPSLAADGEITTNINGSGTNSFGPITFEEEGEYLYTITEQKGNEKGYTYDGSVYDVVIRVTNVNGERYEHTVTITKQQDDSWNGSMAEFINFYENELTPIPNPDPNSNTDPDPLPELKPEPTPPVPTEEISKEGSNPQTGDSSLSSEYLELLAMSSASALLIIKKRKMNQNSRV